MLASTPAPTATAPVVATRCAGGVTSVELTEHATYDATFVNQTNSAADEVLVVIPYGRRRSVSFDIQQPIPAHGSLSVHLHKNLPGGLYAYASDQNVCNVRYVHFVDGTAWGSQASP